MTKREHNSNLTQRLMPLWSGVLIPAMIWALQMEINFSLVRKSCSSKIKLFTVTAIALILIAISISITWSNTRQLKARADQDESLTDTDNFVSGWGLMSGLMFLVATIAQGVSIVFFDPCQL